MRECPFPNCRVLETQGYMFTCEHHPIPETTSKEYSQDLWQPLAELVTETLHTGKVYPGMTDEVAEMAKHLRDIEHHDERTALELREQQNEINDKRYIEETKRLSTQREKQLTLCAAELQVQCYRRFKVCHGAQIDRESISPMKPEQRRRIMK
ncbi:hypothetical protein IWW48_003917 [Coemansia sp. RSA 1200]|nr:hypothetical protein IWW48_003917 [Coemansia sp. RSA 1200]